MEGEARQEPSERSPGEPRRLSAREHFHIALAAIVIPVSAFLISGALALYDLRRQRASSSDPESSVWTRRLLALAFVDLLVLIGTIASLTVKPAPSAATAGPPPQRFSDALPAGLPSLLWALAAIAILLAGACLWIAWRRARSVGAEAPRWPSPLRFWLAFVGVLAASDAALVGAYLLSPRLFGSGATSASLLSLTAGSGTLLVAAAIFRAALVRKGALPAEPARAATLPTVLRGVGYMLAGVTRVAIIVGGLLPLLGLPRPDPSRELQELLARGLGPSGIAVLLFAAVILAPIGEEILFRGTLLPWLRRSLRAETAIWLSAVIFGVGHLRYGAFVLVIIVYGLVLGWARLRTGNLRASIALHILINAAAAALALARR
jgi:uncharacterized protein